MKKILKKYSVSIIIISIIFVIFIFFSFVISVHNICINKGIDTDNYLNCTLTLAWEKQSEICKNIKEKNKCTKKLFCAWYIEHKQCSDDLKYTNTSEECGVGVVDVSSTSCGY